MKYKRPWIIGAITLVIASSSYGCVATSADTPQQQIPQAVAINTNLSYQLETYYSQVMGCKRTYGVSLPPGYEQNPNQHYPVIFLLHGGHGNPTDWFEKQKGSALTTLQQLYTADKLSPSIIITPDGNDQRGSSPYFDPQYIDGPNGKVSTAIGDELVKVVASRYRTLPNPNFWAIGGLSSGGWGAVNVGLHHLDQFSILFSHSGYFVDQSGVQNSPMDYIKTLSSQSRERLRIYLDTGSGDSHYLKQAQKFHALLNQLQVENEFNQFPGTHSWQYWRKHLVDSLAFVGDQFRSFAKN